MSSDLQHTNVHELDWVVLPPPLLGGVPSTYSPQGCIRGRVPPNTRD